MEAVDALNDATPPLIEAERADDADVIVLDDSLDNVQIIDPTESRDEPMPATVPVEAVIDHAPAAADDEAAMEVAGGEDDADNVSTPDTLPMYEESRVDTPVEPVEGDDAEAKEPSPSTEGESSQSQPAAGDAADAAKDKLANGNLPATYPHCYICGFDRETTFLREKKATSGQYKNKIIYRNRCVRKLCNRYFGPTYVWDSKAGEFVKIGEESGAGNRPYASAPRDEKYPALDYERAAESGVRPPIDNNGGWQRAAKTPKTAVTGADSVTPSTSTPRASPAVAPLAKRVSSSSKASGSKAKATLQKRTAVVAKKKKKPRHKGYQWVQEEDTPVRPRHDQVMELARMYAAQNAAEKAPVRAPVIKRTFATQTGDDDHLVSVLVEDMKTKATFKGMPPNEEVPMTAALSNRLFLSQKLIRKQTAEIKSLRAERDFLKDKLAQFTELMAAYRKDMIADTARLKEDVQVANKELRNFSMEMLNEAKKDIKDITKIKDQVAKRIDDSDRIRRKVEASVEYQQSMTREAECLANNLHKLNVELEKDMAVAKYNEEDAKAKLKDKIYLTNNARCGNCHVSERIKNMLTEQIADKTLCATNLGKERAELAKKLENLERVAAIMSKENKQLKFEKGAWEANCHRFRSELQALKGNNAGVVVAPSSTPSAASIGEAAFTPQSTSTKDAEEVTPERSGDESIEVDRPPPATSASSAEEGEYKSPSNLSPNSLARLPPPPVPPPAAQLKVPSPEVAHGFSNWVPKEKKPQGMPPEMVEAMRKVAEALERGPPPKKDEKGPHKKDKRDEKGGTKRSGGYPQTSNSQHKNGEKRPKLDGGVKKEEKGPPARSIPTLGSGPKVPATPSPGMIPKQKDSERRIKEERISQPSPVPYKSAHEPAYPAVVAKKAVKVPYNGPSSLVAGSVPTSSSSHSSPIPQKGGHHRGSPEKKPLSFLPVAGSSAMPPLTLASREPAPIPVPVDDILRQAQLLKSIEAEREMRRQREQMAARQRADPYRRTGDFDDDLPWNQGRAPVYQQPPRPRTPVQDWYYDAPSGHAPPPQPRAPSPSRYYDDMYNPRAPRDQYGRLEPDFGVMRHPQHLPPAHQNPRPHPMAPPLRGAPPPQDAAWRREWHDQNWSDEPPARRGYWD